MQRALESPLAPTNTIRYTTHETVEAWNHTVLARPPQLTTVNPRYAGGNLPLSMTEPLAPSPHHSSLPAPPGAALPHLEGYGAVKGLPAGPRHHGGLLGLQGACHRGLKHLGAQGDGKGKRGQGRAVAGRG